MSSATTPSGWLELPITLSGSTSSISSDTTTAHLSITTGPVSKPPAKLWTVAAWWHFSPTNAHPPGGNLECGLANQPWCPHYRGDGASRGGLTFGLDTSLRTHPLPMSWSSSGTPRKQWRSGIEFWISILSLGSGSHRTFTSAFSTGAWFHVKQSDPIPTPPPEAAAKLRQWEALLRKASRSQNLVSEADLPYLWERHILDSIAPLLAQEPLNLSKGGLWLDIGSGAGLPVIPLAICLPHWSFVAIEPRTLRAQHLVGVQKELGLSNLRVLCSKSEALVNFPDLRQKASVVSTRAVGKIPEDARRAHPFLLPEGLFVTFKHLETVASIDGYHPLSYVRYRLPSVEEPRSLVLATLSSQAET